MSFIYQVPASQLIGERIGLTAALVGLAALFAVVITVPLATLAAARKNTVADHAVRGISVIGLGLPAFWFGIVLIEIFAIHLHWLPVGGIGTGVGGYLESLILPAITASFAIVPILVRSLRVGMIEVLDAEFVATARAKGLSEPYVLFSIVARNAVVPTVTFLGLNIAYLIGTTVIVEQVFNLNGLGSLLLEFDPQPRLPRRAGRDPRARHQCRLDQPGDGPRRGPSRSPDPAPMSTSPPLSDILDDPEYTLPRRNGFWHRARRSPSFIAGVVITGIIVLVAILAPWISPYSPDHQDLYNILSGFSARHPLGTDQLGRDELSRLLWASRTDLQVGVIAVIFPFCFGTLMGTLTGYFGGWFDAIVMRIVDVVIAFPFYVLVIGLVFVVGEGTKGIYIAFAVVDWVVYARAVRSTTLIVRESDYVAAAKGGGLSHWRVILLPRPAEHGHAGRRLRDERHRARDRRGRHARLPRTGHSAADAGLGDDDQ